MGVISFNLFSFILVNYLTFHGNVAALPSLVVVRVLVLY